MTTPQRLFLHAMSVITIIDLMNLHNQVSLSQMALL